jgi:hypothetical protein
MSSSSAPRRRALRSPGAAAVLALSAVITAGCISGRVLSGYPGYPFASFQIPVPADSAFYDLQVVLEDEGYPIDYTDHASGLIQTRPGPNPAKPLFLTVVIGTDPVDPHRTEVWVAGFETTPAGARRVNPLDGDVWPYVMGISGLLSERLGGTQPLGPDERAELEDERSGPKG